MTLILLAVWIWWLSYFLQGDFQINFVLSSTSCIFFSLLISWQISRRFLSQSGATHFPAPFGNCMVVIFFALWLARLICYHALFWAGGFRCIIVNRPQYEAPGRKIQRLFGLYPGVSCWGLLWILKDRNWPIGKPFQTIFQATIENRICCSGGSIRSSSISYSSFSHSNSRKDYRTLII